MSTAERLAATRPTSTVMPGWFANLRTAHVCTEGVNASATITPSNTSNPPTTNATIFRAFIWNLTPQQQVLLADKRNFPLLRIRERRERVRKVPTDRSGRWHGHPALGISASASSR